MKTVSLHAWLSNSRVQTDLMDLELVEIGSSRRIRPVLVIQTALFHVIRLLFTCLVSRTTAKRGVLPLSGELPNRAHRSTRIGAVCLSGAHDTIRG